MYLNDVLKIYGIDPNDCCLIRYGLYESIKQDIEKYGLKKYLSSWIKTTKKYVLFFLGESTYRSILLGFYKTGNYIPKEKYKGQLISPKVKGIQELFDTPELNEMINRLEIENDLRVYKLVNFSHIKVSAIYPKENKRIVKQFNGYENIYLSFEELKEIIDNGYQDYVITLKAINAIYMIIDKTTGKQYIGSSYGEDGLYGRWRSYIQTGDGGNLMLKELKEKDKEHYVNYNFMILKTLPIKMNPKEIQNIESDYKEKYLTRKYGLNKN